MSFVSLEFIIFLSIALALNYLLKGNARKVLLIFLSFYFYSTFTKYSFFIFIFTFLIYTYALILGFVKNSTFKRVILYGQLISVLSLFIYFKYLGFLSDILTNLTGKTFIQGNPAFAFIGISYVMFQSFGYLFDVYYERIKAEKNILNFTLLIIYFPKLISGPIEKSKIFLMQCNFRDKSINTVLFSRGFKFFVYGFFIKSVIADRLSFPVSRLFSTPLSFDSIITSITVIFYSFQLYTDFMAYSLMALGISLMLGIEIINNFNLPYFAESVSDFWKRWHISLSKWLRDYIFLPLNYAILRPKSILFKIFRRPEKFSYIVTTIITMTICGFWHGANWTFIIWGIIHAFYMIFGFITKKLRKSISISLGLYKSNISKVGKIIITFSIITFAFLFFRADSINAAFKIIHNIFSFSYYSSTEFWFYNPTEFYSCIFFLIIFIIFEIVLYINNKNLTEYLNAYVIFALILTIIVFGKFGENDFLYFKF